jgi:hypothetical protein
MIRVEVTRTRGRTALSSFVGSSQSARVARGMIATGEKLLELSREIVPEDTKTLYNDGHVRTEGNGLGMVVVVGYGTFGLTVAQLSNKEKNRDGTPRMVLRVPYDYAVYAHETETHRYTKGEREFLKKPRFERLTDLQQAFKTGYQSGGATGGQSS